MTIVRTNRKSLRWYAATLLLGLLSGALLAHSARAGEPSLPSDPAQPGVAVTYQLPVDGPLPRTYRVTLAITDPHDPNWIVSTFVAGAPRTVTRENQGRFTETWDGLDDNFMPVPAGTYGVKGIYMPAQQWSITGELHTFLPRFAVGAGDSWLPARGEERKKPSMWGAGFGTLSDVAIAPGGKAIFYRNYVEGSENPFVVDLTKPIGHDQIVRGYSSGGTAGGPAVATDGETVWSASWDNGEPNFIYRADRQPFGTGRSRYRSGVYVADKPIVSLAAWRDPASGRRYLYVAEADAGVLTLDGGSAEEIGRSPLKDIRSLVVHAGTLYALHKDDAGAWRISRALLSGDASATSWQPFATLAAPANPTDFKIGFDGALYVSDLKGNQVYKLDLSGRIVRMFGRATEQRPGHYDDHVFMSPGKLGLWTDAQGHERLIVIEHSGAGRVSEWSTEGILLRQWFPAQPHAVFGYAVDPDDPEHVYMATSEPASGSGLLRFRVDYDTGAWRLDAVWPNISRWEGFPGGLWYPKIINFGGRKYLAFARTHGANDRYGYMLYRLDGDHWVPSAAIVPGAGASGPDWKQSYWWHDANGDGELQETEYRDRPARLPATPRYWGETWLDDLSLTIVEQNGRSVWRLAPSGFDAHGNPIYDGGDWRRLLTDPAFAARAAGNADALHGGNEIGDRFNIDWTSVDGDTENGFYVSGYSGPPWPDGIDSTGRLGSQVKITRYVPDGKGGFTALWRVGRKALGVAKPGEIYGSQHVTAPINHILGVSDGNGLYHLFTDEGLYLDTLLIDVSRGGAASGGLYAPGGELFNGYVFSNRSTGQVYLAMGRNAATFFAIDGWTTTSNSFSKIATLPEKVAIAARQIAAVPEAAVRAHGGAAHAKVARFVPATGGGPALDGSLRGWEAVEPLTFGLDAERRVEVRTMYDPDTLYLRWHVRLPDRFQARDIGAPERLFADSRAADTVSVYIQGDPSAGPAGRDSRPGDTRILFAVVRDGGELKPAAVAFFPQWAGSAPHPVTFASAVARTTFAHVQRLTDGASGYAIDADGKGFVIATAIARADLPLLPALTQVPTTTINFAATFAGKATVWWANADGSASTVTSDEPAEAGLYPGSWTQAHFVPLKDALPVRTWLVSGPWGGEELSRIRPDDKPALLHYFDAARYPPDQPDRDWLAAYRGPLATDIDGKSHRLAWQPAPSGPGSMLRLGGVARVYFAAAWIFAPEDTEIACTFLTERQNVTRIWINGEPVRSRTAGTPPLELTTPVERQSVHFHKGWNQVLARSYAVGYDAKLGMVLHGAPDLLWRIGQSPAPPEIRR